MNPYLPLRNRNRRLGAIAILVSVLVGLTMFLTTDYIYNSILEYRSSTLLEQARILKGFLEAESGTAHEDFVRHFFNDKQGLLKGHSELLTEFLIATEKDGGLALILKTRGQPGRKRQPDDFILLNDQGGVLGLSGEDQEAGFVKAALDGQSGSVEYTGPDGEKMMAVYLPVKILDRPHGLLAQVSVHGLKEILMHKVLLISLTGLVLIGLGAWLFFRLNPMLAELTHSQEEAIAMLGQASHYKDTVERMAEYAAAIGRAMGMSKKELYMLGLAAKMHDLGKVGTPDAVLKKPAKLNAEEWEIMKQHSYLGRQIMRKGNTPLFQMAQEIAWGHHEKYDGSGYPRGLQKEGIPLTARITAVADVFDALTMKRPYKDAWPVEKALALIQEESGSHFDEQVVDAFMGITDEILAIKERWAEQEQAELEALRKDDGSMV